MKNIMYVGTVAALIDIDLEVIRGLLAETFAKKPALVESNMKAIEIGYRYAKEHFDCPLPIRVERMNATAGPRHDRRQHGRRARLPVRGRDRRRLVPDHALDLADGRLPLVLRRATAPTRRPASATT